MLNVLSVSNSDASFAVSSSSLPTELDLTAIRASLVASLPSSNTATDCTPRRPLSSSIVARRSSRHALVKSITKRLRSMKSLLSEQHPSKQQQQQPLQHDSDAEVGSDGDKENDSADSIAVPGQRQSAGVGSNGSWDSTSEERPSTAESEHPHGSSRRAEGGKAKRSAAAAAAHWQRILVALSEENEQLRASLASEREAAVSLATSAGKRLEAELDKQARRYDGIIQEKDDEISQLRALIQGMNDTMLNNTQQLIDAQAELEHTTATAGMTLRATQLSDGADEDGDIPEYPTLTPGSSPLLSPNKLAVLLDDTQDIITFDASRQSAHRPPLPPMSPIRCGNSRNSGSGSNSASSKRTATLAPSGVASSAASPLKSVAVAAAADASQLSAAWQRYLDVNQVERERQLAQLPLTSPSTPGSKRRKIASPSPLSAAHNSKQQHSKQPTPPSAHDCTAAVVTPSSSHSRSHTALSGQQHGAVKQLCFHSTSHEQQYECEQKDVAPGQPSAPLLHRRADSTTVLETNANAATGRASHSALSSNTRKQSNARDGVANGSKHDHVTAAAEAVVADSEAGDALSLQSVDADGDELVCLSASDGRRVSAELRRLRLLLDVKNEWSVRMKAMSGIELLSRESGIGRWSEWGKELEALRPLLCDQLTDLRSAVVREACRVLVALATASRAQFEREVDVYYPLLFKGLFVTIRVIRESCDECLQALTQRTASVRCLPALLLGCADPHAVVREKCGSYINTLLEAAAASAAAADLSQLDPQSSDIAAAIGKLVQDSDHNTRATARQLYRTFSKHFPSRAATVHSNFPQQVQKALDAERKAGASKQSGQATKKKK